MRMAGCVPDAPLEARARSAREIPARSTPGHEGMPCHDAEVRRGQPSRAPEMRGACCREAEKTDRTHERPERPPARSPTPSFRPGSPPCRGEGRKLGVGNLLSPKSLI